MIKPACILRVLPVDQIGQGPDLPSVRQAHRAENLAIDLVDLLALGQIGMRRLDLVGRNPEGNALASSAMIKPQHEAGSLDRATMADRIDAERPMRAAEQGRNALDIREARPPHQRAIAEDPEVLAGDLRSD
jgi:hypothetical protein